jgi:hypothetical protein
MHCFNDGLAQPGEFALETVLEDTHQPVAPEFLPFRIRCFSDAISEEQNHIVLP